MLSQQRTQLVESLLSEGYIKTDRVKEAFFRVHREDFLPADQQEYAYADIPLQIGHGQTISAPHMVAIMCEGLDLQQGQTVLEVGTGSGYHAAIVATLIGPTGHLYSIERFASLARHAKDSLVKAGIENVSVEVGDGSLGLPEHQPYDRIYVTCAAPTITPPLFKQLREGGKLLIPVGDLYCDLLLVEKRNGTQHAQSLGGCLFVPLVGKHGH